MDQPTHQTVVFGPGSVGLQLEEDSRYGSRVVRFVDGGPSYPGPARACGVIQPGDWIIRVAVVVATNDKDRQERGDHAEGRVVATTAAPAATTMTYSEIMSILQQTHWTRELTVRSFAASVLLLLLDVEPCSASSKDEIQMASESLKDCGTNPPILGDGKCTSISNESSSTERKDKISNKEYVIGSTSATTSGSARATTQRTTQEDDKAVDFISKQESSFEKYTATSTKLPLHLLIQSANYFPNNPLLLNQPPLGRNQTTRWHNSKGFATSRQFGIQLSPTYSGEVEPRLFHQYQSPPDKPRPDKAYYEVRNNVHLKPSTPALFPGIISLPSSTAVTTASNRFKTNVIPRLVLTTVAFHNSDLDEKRPLFYTYSRCSDNGSCQTTVEQRQESGSVSSLETILLYVNTLHERPFPGEIALPSTVAACIHRRRVKIPSSFHPLFSSSPPSSSFATPSITFCLDEKQTVLLLLSLQVSNEKTKDFSSPKTISQMGVDPSQQDDADHDKGATAADTILSCPHFLSSAAHSVSTEEGDPLANQSTALQQSITTNVHPKDLLQKARSKHQLSLARLRVKNQVEKSAADNNKTDTANNTASTVVPTTTSSNDLFQEKDDDSKLPTTIVTRTSDTYTVDEEVVIEPLQRQPSTSMSKDSIPADRPPPSAPTSIDFSQFSQEKTIIFEPGPVGMQVEATTFSTCTSNNQNQHHFEYYYPAKIVRFVDGFPTDPGQARRSGQLRPGDFVVRVEAEGIVGTTYYTILHLLQKSWTARKLTFRSAWDPSSIVAGVNGPCSESRTEETSLSNTTPSSSVLPPSGTKVPRIVPSVKSQASTNQLAYHPPRQSPLKEISPHPHDWTPLPFDWVNKRRQPLQQLSLTVQERQALEESYQIEAARLFREREEKRRQRQAEEDQRLLQTARLSSWNFEDFLLGAVAVTAESVIGCFTRKQHGRDRNDHSDDDEEEEEEDEYEEHQKNE